MPKGELILKIGTLKKAPLKPFAGTKEKVLQTAFIAISKKIASLSK